MIETKEYGFDKLQAAQWQLGNDVRAYLKGKGITSVAADGYGAPGVVVSYTDDPAIQNGSKFSALGMQIAAGVPLQCDEPDDFRTFRLGLFGLDKLYDVDSTMGRLTKVLDQVL
jgi:aspartate aminotransferase-like enzyme